jgi:uncharacterized protein
MARIRTEKSYRVRHSAIHGRGVFATTAIRKGALIIEYRGQRTTWDIVNSRPHSDPDNPEHTFIFETSDGSVIDGGRRGNAARWMNHSCSPNCKSFEADDGRVYIEARRAISAGEELTYDYRLSLDGRITRRIREAYACRCGARRCRGSLLLDIRAKAPPRGIE